VKTRGIERDFFGSIVPRLKRCFGSTSEPSAFGGFKFRRQHRVDAYFVDLCCAQKRLTVELDGGDHADQRDQDAARTAYLAEQGYRVIRFWNEQVNREMDDVPEAIYVALTDS